MNSIRFEYADDGSVTVCSEEHGAVRWESLSDLAAAAARSQGARCLHLTARIENAEELLRELTRAQIAAHKALTEIADFNHGANCAAARDCSCLLWLRARASNAAAALTNQLGMEDA